MLLDVMLCNLVHSYWFFYVCMCVCVCMYIHKHSNLKIEAAINIFNSLPHSLTSSENEVAKLKVVLGKYLNTHSIYSVEEFFVCKDDLQCCFVKCL
jgi:hypothetical protein